MPFLRDIERFRTEIFDFRKNTLRVYKLMEAHKQILKKLSYLEKKLWAENINDSKKQTLCNQMEELVKKLEEKHTEWIRITRPEVRTQEFVIINVFRIHYQDLIKLIRHSKDCGNQTSLVSSISAADKDPNKTVIDTGNGAIENAEENVEVSSRLSATQGSRKEPSIANSRSSRRRQIDEMELKNLRAKKETKQHLRERQLELEREREQIVLS